MIRAEFITEEQYAGKIEAGKRAICPLCGDQYDRANGIDGPESPTGNRYCSEGCVISAERAAAPLVKRQPPGVTIEGWSI